MADIAEVIGSESVVLTTGGGSVVVLIPPANEVSVTTGATREPEATTPQSNTTVHNTQTIQPLDGSVPITGNIPVVGNVGIGTPSAPLGYLHADELHVGANTLYVDGQPAVGIDNGRVQYSGANNTDVVVRAKGTGKLIIDAEDGGIEINAINVTVNGSAVANYNFAREIFVIPADLNLTIRAVLTHIPLPLTERVILNGVELTDGVDYDYTIWQNVITFNSGVLTNDGHIKVTYNY